MRPTTLNLPVAAHRALRHMAAASGSTLGAAAIQVLRDAFPAVQAAWQSYSWPPRRGPGSIPEGQQAKRMAVAVHVPPELRAQYFSVGIKLLERAYQNGRMLYVRDPETGDWTAPASPTNWLMQTALIGHIPVPGDADPPPARVKTSNISGGPFVLVPLPVPVITWMDNKRLNRSAFIRGAIEAQLPALSAATTVPTSAQLMPDAPQRKIQVRMSDQMHATIGAAASIKGVTRTHLMRAAVLIHLARQTARPSTTRPTKEAA